MSTRGGRSRWERIAHWVAEQSGRPWAFALAAIGIVVWLVSGPIFGFSDTWQLVVNTATTIITFLMVFLIQQAQNKEARAMELKLDELIAATGGASNRLIDIEELSEDELIALRRRYEHLVERAPSADTVTREPTRSAG